MKQIDFNKTEMKYIKEVVISLKTREVKKKVRKYLDF